MAERTILCHERNADHPAEIKAARYSNGRALTRGVSLRQLIARPARRPLAGRAALALAGLLFAGLAVFPGSPAVALDRPYSDIELIAATEFTDPSGVLTVVGEVRNSSGRTVDPVRIIVDQVDGAGRLLGSSPTFTMSQRLDDGESSPFKTYLVPARGYHHWQIRLIGADPAISPANRRFDFTIAKEYYDGDGLHHVEGTVRNLNSGRALLPVIVGSFHDGDGDLATAEYAVPDLGDRTDMEGGASAPFHLVRFDGPADLPLGAVEFTGEARQRPQPAADHLDRRSGSGFPEWAVALSRERPYDQTRHRHPRRGRGRTPGSDGPRQGMGELRLLGRRSRRRRARGHE